MTQSLRRVHGTGVRVRTAAAGHAEDPAPAGRGIRTIRDEQAAHDDDVVVEEPLEIRISGEVIAITMRTPGHDRQLVMGFLWAEGIVASLDDVAAIAHCGRPGTEGFGNTIEVTPSPGARLRLPEETAVRRGTIVSAACGVCGRTSIDDLLARCSPVAGGGTMDASSVARAAAHLREHQPVFARSGGCHAASLVTRGGEHVETYEDVGRHNAVDKLVGARVLARALPASDHALFVSGRTSFEIVQKAVAAGIPIVVGVSAASSLAVDVAARAGITLVGFCRDDRFYIYTGAERIAVGA
jgi:FdhD protein